ncbi:hypothetical protein M514_00379 [Trichuris suis]|uniref:Uncharacterized protein n=1 Tax=Trichuris suis TaxID=68888 RepID=A0A085MN90_9BILA|nr:hypothetical protein M513_00379 [Trichuris suis]KFD71967.1 hypothetical protein M514_00379 [Trichuris suis]
MARRCEKDEARKRNRIKLARRQKQETYRKSLSDRSLEIQCSVCKNIRAFRMEISESEGTFKLYRRISIYEPYMAYSQF